MSARKRLDGGGWAKYDAVAFGGCMRIISATAVMILGTSLLLPAQDLFPVGPGRDTFMKVCMMCHDVDMIATFRYSKDEWADLVYSMKDMGAEAADDEWTAIIDYLAKNFPRELPHVKVNTSGAYSIRDGLGITLEEATAIVDYRKEHGEFKNFDDLLKVPGIDTAKLESAKDRIEF